MVRRPDLGCVSGIPPGGGVALVALRPLVARLLGGEGVADELRVVVAVTAVSDPAGLRHPLPRHTGGGGVQLLLLRLRLLGLGFLPQGHLLRIRLLPAGVVLHGRLLLLLYLVLLLPGLGLRLGPAGALGGGLVGGLGGGGGGGGALTRGGTRGRGGGGRGAGRHGCCCLFLLLGFWMGLGGGEPGEEEMERRRNPREIEGGRIRIDFRWELGGSRSGNPQNFRNQSPAPAPTCDHDEWAQPLVAHLQWVVVVGPPGFWEGRDGSNFRLRNVGMLFLPISVYRVGPSLQPHYQLSLCYFPPHTFTPSAKRPGAPRPGPCHGVMDRPKHDTPRLVSGP